jgi:hypothetical protein
LNEFALASVLFCASCNPWNPYPTTIVARLRDPARASLRWGATGQEILPEGRAPAAVTVADGSFELRPGTRLPYNIRIVRETNGALAFDHGVRDDIVAVDGKVMSLGAGAIAPDMLTGGEAVFGICATLWLERYHRGPHVRNDYGECSPEPTFHGQLVTPWSNVVEIRRERRAPNRWASWLFTVLTVGPLVGFGVPLVAGRPFDCSSNSTGCRAGGATMLAVGAAILVVAGPSLFTPERTEVVFPSPATR